MPGAPIEGRTAYVRARGTVGLGSLAPPNRLLDVLEIGVIQATAEEGAQGIDRIHFLSLMTLLMSAP